MMNSVVANICVYGLVAIMVVLAAEAHETVSEAANCRRGEVVTPCLKAIVRAAPPSAECCSKVKMCYCIFFRDLSLSRFITSPHGRKFAAECGVPSHNICPRAC
ncbi:hypothetical protein CDL12_27584 [Handroanthus impetiginosus]|uniref:Bifunctional inhibitor/plant lipid transfer protein/seed storage helical domain-containing protein n=1 Tax=Handroanthus impetiginosus TaxID=429701 RepID=A0A2G9G449_9LAMI|nr:hypothetical protein CDL12_27584 [Handroanthus impetiginosus]